MKFQSKESPELALGMKQQLRVGLPNKKEKLASILTHLNLAAEAFEEARRPELAELTTQATIDLSSQFSKGF